MPVKIDIVRPVGGPGYGQALTPISEHTPCFAESAVSGHLNPFPSKKALSTQAAQGEPTRSMIDEIDRARSYGHARRTPGGDEIAVAKAFAAVEHRDDARRHAKDADLIRGPAKAGSQDT
jgi:hypothetical protein